MIAQWCAPQRTCRSRAVCLQHVRSTAVAIVCGMLCVRGFRACVWDVVSYLVCFNITAVNKAGALQSMRVPRVHANT